MTGATGKCFMCTSFMPFLLPILNDFLCNHAVILSQERKISPKRKLWAGYPCEHSAKKFGQVLQILDFWGGGGTDLPRGRP